MSYDFLVSHIEKIVWVKKLPQLGYMHAKMSKKVEFFENRQFRQNGRQTLKVVFDGKMEYFVTFL